MCLRSVMSNNPNPMRVTVSHKSEFHHDKRLEWIKFYIAVFCTLRVHRKVLFVFTCSELQ